MTTGRHAHPRIGTTTRRLTTLGAACLVAGAFAVSGWWHPSVVPALSSSPAAAVSSPDPAPNGSSAAVATGSRPTTSSPSARAARLAPDRIRIPAIGVDTTLVRLGLTHDGALAVPTRAMSAGWYTGSPVPGRVGPAVIAGHVHWSGAPAVFARLTELAPGDRITVSRSDGSTVVFTVDRVATYPKSRFPTALVYGALTVPGLRLITCGGFDPVARSYDANVIVFATLVAT